MAENADKIEELKKRLYRKEGFQLSHRRAQFTSPAAETPHTWEPEGKEEPEMSKEIVSLSVVKKVFLASIVFFVVVVSLAFLFSFRGSNVVSADNIDIEVSGPTSVKGGETLPLELTVLNRNSVSLEAVDLIITFPAGARNPDNLSLEQGRTRKNLGTIAPAIPVKELVKSVLFGKEGSQQEIKISLEYRTPGSNAIFVKEKSYIVTLTSSPLNLVVSVPKELQSGDQATISVSVNSNSTSVLKNILLEANYPSGFSIVSASPSAAFGSGVWNLGDLPPGATRKIEIKGVVQGQDEEVKAFRFTVGLASATDERHVGTPYASAFETLSIKRPFVGLELTLSGDSSSEITTDAGRELRGDITWENNLPTRILDGEVTVTFRGQILDKSSVSVLNGFYRSSDNTIVWTKQNVSDLGEVLPGASGHVSFSFSTLSLAALRTANNVNPQMEIEVTFRGNSLAEGTAGTPVQTSIKKILKLNSQLNVAARAVYFVGPFTNSGPLPPKVDKETTYTVLWTVTSGLSDASNVEVRATLPSYMKWVGSVAPAAEGVTFDPASGQIVWKVGKVGRAALGTSPREVAFQVSLLGSVSQVNRIPTILSESRLSWTDDFTGATLSSVARELTTRLSTDPQFTEGMATVVQ